MGSRGDGLKVPARTGGTTRDINVGRGFCRACYRQTLIARIHTEPGVPDVGLCMPCATDLVDAHIRIATDAAGEVGRG